MRIQTYTQPYKWVGVCVCMRVCICTYYEHLVCVAVVCRLNKLRFELQIRP